MLILFWDERGVILEHCMPRWNTVNSGTYADLLKIICFLQSSPNDADVWVQVFCCNMKCLAPYCPFKCCNKPRSVLRVSSTSAVLATPRPQWLSCLWTAQRGDGRQVFQVWRRGAAGNAWVAALSAKRLFFSRGIPALPKRWNTSMVRNGDYVEKWSHCVPFAFNKLRDRKYLVFYLTQLRMYV